MARIWPISVAILLIGAVLAAAAQVQPWTSQESAREALDCFYKAFPSVQLGCSGGKGSNGTASGPRDAMVKMLQACLAPPSARQEVTIFAAQFAWSTRVVPLTKAYSEQTGIPLRVDMEPLISWGDKLGLQLANARNRSLSHDAWFLPITSFLGDGVRAKAFQNLTSLVALDTRLGWSGLLPILRDTVLLYDSEVVALPSSAYTYHLTYRKDLFAQYNLTLPRTWQELVDLSRAYNGTAGKFAFCGNFSPCLGYGATLLTAILQSLVQTKGVSQGWLPRPERLQVAFTNAASEESLRLLKALHQVSAPDNALLFGCPWYNQRFATGQCLMAIQTSNAFKYASHVSRRRTAGPVQGNVGFAPWLGTERVLDWSTNSLVPCTTERCPHATRHANSDGTTTLVNIAPSVDCVSAVLNANTPKDLSFFAYQVLAYVTSVPVNDQLTFDANTEASPIRTSQLDVRRWVAAGYNAQDAAEFVASFSELINHPNAALAARFPGSPDMAQTVINMALQSLTMPISRVLNNSAVSFAKVINATYGTNFDLLMREFYASLNRKPPSPPPGPSPPVSSYPPAPSAAPTTDGNRLVSLLVPLCVTLGSFALAIGGIFLARRYGWLGKSRKTVASAPGVSPFTTICITDIEDSTNLWEEMEAQVVDTAVKLHNVCLRGLVAKHGGYESIWEGDSFIIAFHHPREALAFCMEAQMALLHMPWPSELLSSSRGEEVWCQRSTNTNMTPDDGAAEAQQGTLSHHYGRIWQRCANTVEGAMLAYRGLRVRMGLHSGVDSEAMITFNTTMQRVHYSGPTRVTCNAVASAGHGGHTMISSDVARLLDPDSTGTLPSLPCECGVFYMGQHTLAGVEAPQDLLLALPDSLQCRLSVQQAPLRTVRERAAGILAAPVPSSMQSDPCALVFVRFSGLSELLAWNQEQTLAAVASAATCLRTLLADMGGCLSEDGLQIVLDTRSGRSSNAAFPDSCKAGQVVAAFSGPASAQLADQPSPTSQHPAASFALQLRSDLLMLDWHPDLLSHGLCHAVGAFGSEAIEETNLQPDEDNEKLPEAGPESIPACHSSQPQPTTPTSSTPKNHQPVSLRFTPQPGTTPSVASRQSGMLSVGGSLMHASSGSMFSRESHSKGSPIWALSKQEGSGDNRNSDMKPQFGHMLANKLAGSKVSSSVYEALEPQGLRGLRCRMVVVRAQGARFAIATRSSGRVVYLGAPVKEALRILAKSRPGVVTVDKALTGGRE